LAGRLAFLPHKDSGLCSEVYVFRNLKRKALRLSLTMQRGEIEKRYFSQGLRMDTPEGEGNWRSNIESLLLRFCH
ncbi:MAG: hypothetical protein KAW09_12675, partial [Thermoplasmata archaeon]|nr:hypothetical protein [Thermoplasmata archaeon]